MTTVTVQDFHDTQTASGRLWATRAYRHFDAAHNPRIIDWHERFDRESERFEPNELVALFATVRETSPNKFELVARYNPTLADTFAVELPPRDGQALLLKELVGKVFTVTVRIKECLGKEGLHAWRYTCSAVAIITYPNNPTPEELKAFKPRTTFIVEAKVKQLREVPLSEKRSLLAIDLEHSRGTLTAMSYSNALDAEGGVLEQADYGLVTEGEVVRMFCETTPGGVALEKSDAYVLEPSVSRVDAHTSLRIAFGAEKTALEYDIQQGKWVQARERFARVRQLRLTPAELREWSKLIARLPETEQPVIGSQKEYASKLQGWYGTNPEALSRHDFLGFAHKAITLQVPGSPHKMPRYLLDIMGTSVSASEKFEFFKKALAATAQGIGDTDGCGYQEAFLVLLNWDLEPSDQYMAALAENITVVLSYDPPLQAHTYMAICEAVLRIVKNQQALLHHISLDMAVQWLGHLHAKSRFQDEAIKILLAVHQAHRV